MTLGRARHSYGRRSNRSGKRHAAKIRAYLVSRPKAVGLGRRRWRSTAKASLSRLVARRWKCGNVWPSRRTTGTGSF